MTKPETRPQMTLAEFEAAASHRDQGWWATGDRFLYGPEMAAVEGWNLWGHPGNAALTEAQRVLMVWGDLVGQVSNGGFVQFVDNMEAALATSALLIPKLEWPELTRRFQEAYREQVTTSGERRGAVVPLDAEPQKWARSKKRLLRHLAREGKPWWYVPTRRRINFLENWHPEWRLQLLYLREVNEGRLKSGGEKVFEPPSCPTRQAEGFDTWFYEDATKLDSARVVRDFAHARQSELCRLVR